MTDRKTRNLLCVMVSVGERSRLTNVTWPRFAHWCERHGYEAVLLKEDLLKKYGYERPPHFNKCLVPKYFPGYDGYLVADDDILVSKFAPALPSVTEDSFFMARDAEQGYTTAPYVAFNGNTGFLLFGKNRCVVFAEVFEKNVSKGFHTTTDGYNIWGPYDQGAINELAFSKGIVQELDSRYNYSLVPEYWLNADRKKWVSSTLYRLRYYFTLMVPFHPNRKRMQQAFVIHLINCRFIPYVELLYNKLAFRKRF